MNMDGKGEARVVPAMTTHERQEMLNPPGVSWRTSTAHRPVLPLPAGDAGAGPAASRYVERLGSGSPVADGDHGHREREPEVGGRSTRASTRRLDDLGRTLHIGCSGRIHAHFQKRALLPAPELMRSPRGRGVREPVPDRPSRRWDSTFRGRAWGCGTLR